MKNKANKAAKKQTSKHINNGNSKSVIAMVFIGILVIAIFQINFDGILPIKKIKAQGEFINVTEEMILTAISNDVNSGYLNTNVHKIQIKIEKLAWVKIASVRLVWPDSIVVSIIEQKASAIWKKDALLNKDGEIFKPVIITDRNLPVLNGPENLNVNVMKNYYKFESKLNKIDLSISEINLDDRRAIHLHLTNDIRISLGRKKYFTRLSRFITAYKLNLEQFENKIEYVDMRYTNGFSVKWKETRQAVKSEHTLKGQLDV